MRKQQMKANVKVIQYILGIVVAAFMISGCNLSKPYDYGAYPNIHLEEAAYLGDESSSPYCDFSLDYNYLEEEGDSVALLINRALQYEFLGEEYSGLIPSVAVDSFKNTYLGNYRKETGALYEADLRETGNETSVPAWYNQTYSMVTFIEEGRGGIINASANYFVDMGGAHPSQWSRWLNFNGISGKMLQLEDVFQSASEEEIKNILFGKLISHFAEVFPEENIATKEDLQRIGILQFTDIYIPNNFLFSKKGLLFLFNRYDIAPYSAGEIILSVPYEEIEHCLKNELWN